MFIGTEIGIVEHGVGIEDAHHRDLVEVQSLADHLRADEQIGTTCGEVVDDAFVGLTAAGGVEVHAGDTGFGEDVVHLGLDLLRAIAMRLQLGTTAIGTLRRHLIGIAAIMTRQLVQIAMKGERHVAVLAMRHPSTLLTLNHGRIAATVLEEDGLFAMFQGLAHLQQQQRREGAVHHLTVLQILDIHNLYLRQFDALIALGECNKTVFARLGIMIGF